MRKIIIVPLLIIVLAGVGFFGLLFTQTYDPLWNPFRPEPEEVIEVMTEKMKEVKTYRSEIYLNFETKENGSPFQMAIEGDYQTNRTQLQEVKTQGEFNLVFSTEGMEFKLAGEAITIGDTSYFKLTTLPALPFLEPYFQMLGIDIHDLKNQWIKIDPESLKNWYKQTFGEELTPEMEAELEKSLERQRETTQKIKEFLENKKLYIVQKELADEMIDKIKVYHYQVALNREEIIELMPKLPELSRQLNQGTPIASEEIEKMKEFFEKAGDFIAEIWIGKKDNLLYKLDFEKEIDSRKFEETKKGKIIIKLTVNFSEYGEPVQIEPPADFKPVEEFLESFMGSYLESMVEARGRARDAKRQADLRQILFAMELYYDDRGGYLQSAQMPTSIGDYLSQVPQDPGGGPCPGPYQWISNLGHPEQFCAWACLESGKYHAISEKGAKELSFPPTTLDCW